MHWDRRKFWLYGSIVVLLILFLVFGLALPFSFSRFTSGSVPGSPGAAGSSLAWLRSAWWEVGTFLLVSLPPGFVAFLVGEASTSGTVARERDKGTLAALLAQPLRRSEIYLGKYLAKLLAFLIISVVIVLGMILTSTIMLGPQLYLIWAPVIILDLAMIFAFYAAYAQFLSCFFRRSRAVFGVIVLTWFLLFVGMEYAASQRVNLLPYAYFIPINSATLALAGTRAYFANPSSIVQVSPVPGMSLIGTTGTTPFLGGFNFLSFGTDSTFNFAVMATAGLVLGTILFLVLGWWAFRRIEIKG
jgi:ABC-type transport system involved in multi-copper enzyme maturation permease subunit